MPRLPVDLDRFALRCRLSGTFGCDIWLYFEIAIRIATYLDTFAVTRLFITCLVIQVDRSDVALGATAIRLKCPRSCAWTVATPPVQVVVAVSSSASPWWDSSDDGTEA